MRFLKPALAATVALAVVALASPAIGAGSSGDGQLASAAKKCKAKKGAASTAKKGGCKKKGKGKGPSGGGDPKPTPPPVKPTGNTTITLTQYRTNFPSAGTDEVVGSVSSNNPSCVGGRTLSLYEELGVSDALVDTATLAAGSVFFDFPSQTAGDHFYAVATQNTVGETACGPATSNLISKP
jgi:hypothetical protein